MEEYLMNEIMGQIFLVGFFWGLPMWAAYKVGHDNGHSAACDANREITKVNRELYGDCPTCKMELNPVSVKRINRKTK